MIGMIFALSVFQGVFENFKVLKNHFGGMDCWGKTSLFKRGLTFIKLFSLFQYFLKINVLEAC